MTIPRGTAEGGAMLCRFHARENTQYISDGSQLPIIGFAAKDRVRLLRGIHYVDVLANFAPGVYETEYSGSTKITVDYNNETYKLH